MTGPGPLAGRTALVTGASRGIGRAVAVALAEHGTRVRAMSRTEQALEELRAEHGVEPIVVDVRDDAEVWSALDELVERDGAPPDIVVSSAGVFGIEPLASETVNAFDAHLSVNLRAPFLVIRALLPAMLERRSGLIVNIGSVAGRRAFPGNGSYSASKFGLRGLHDVLLEELKGTGVRASLVEPTATDTALWDPLDPDRDASLPSRSEMLRPEDVADAVVFLATRRPGVAIPLLRVERG
jgi:NAD(P)-dependent dehydrogenase (short-subunit alcohol dehydrogenase family)